MRHGPGARQGSFVSSRLACKQCTFRIVCCGILSSVPTSNTNPGKEATVGYDPGSFADDHAHHHGHHHQMPPQETSYTQTNLVSDGSVPAAHIADNLINPWGISHSATSPFWISDNGSGVT